MRVAREHARAPCCAPSPRFSRRGRKNKPVRPRVSLLPDFIPPSEVEDAQGCLLKPLQLPVSERQATTGGTVFLTHLVMNEPQWENEWTALKRVDKDFIFARGDGRGRRWRKKISRENCVFPTPWPSGKMMADFPDSLNPENSD